MMSAARPYEPGPSHRATRSPWAKVMRAPAILAAVRAPTSRPNFLPARAFQRFFRTGWRVNIRGAETCPAPSMRSLPAPNDHHDPNPEVPPEPPPPQLTVNPILQTN